MKYRDLAIGLIVVLTFPAVFSMIPGSTSVVGKADLTNRLFFACLTGMALFLWQILTHGWLPLLYTLISKYLRK